LIELAPSEPSLEVQFEANSSVENEHILSFPEIIIDDHDTHPNNVEESKDLAHESEEEAEESPIDFQDDASTTSSIITSEL
jgi:hypothetical protein